MSGHLNPSCSSTVNAANVGCRPGPQRTGQIAFPGFDRACHWYNSLNLEANTFPSCRLSNIDCSLDLLRGRPQLRPAAGISSLDASSWRPVDLMPLLVGICI